MAEHRASPETVEAVASALHLLGEAYRGDWSNFDGRSLRAELDELSGVLRTGAWPDGRPFYLAVWAAASGICPVCASWTEHCRHMGGGS